LDFFEPEDWVKYQLSVFSLGRSEEHFEHLKRVVHNARYFRTKWLRFKEDIKYPPIAILISKDHPTKVEILHDGPNSVKRFDFQSCEKIVGDGRVSAIGATPFTGFEFETFYTKHEHSSLLDDAMVLQIVKNLNEGKHSKT